MNAPAPKTSPDAALGNLMGAALGTQETSRPAAQDDTVTRTGNTAANQAGWLLIESAPKTGRTLLLGYRNSLGKWRTVRGQWMSFDYIANHWEEPDDVEEGWFETAVEAEEIPNCWPITPTHWMPLPAEPGAAPAAPVSTVEQDEQAAFERWFERTCPSGDVEAVQRQWEASSDYDDFHAPAAGDALDAARYRWLRDESWAGYNQDKRKPQVAEAIVFVADGAGNVRTILAEEALDAAIDAAIAAQRKGDA